MAFFPRVAISTSLAFATLCAHGVAVAGDITIVSGQTETTAQTLTTAGDVIMIENGGRIEVNDAKGVVMGLDDQTAISHGVIVTTGDTSHGIDSNGLNAVISNDGSIGASGFKSYGIRSRADYVTISNSGLIETMGDSADGIFSSGLYAKIDNSGLIHASGPDANGIYSKGDQASVTNSGTIVAEQGDAIYLEDTHATLTLLAGSQIVGGIVFNKTSTATLIIGSGLDTALTLTGIPAAIDTSGRPYVLDGNVLAVVDPASFAASVTVVNDLTRGIADALDAHMGTIPAGGTATMALGYFGDGTAGGANAAAEPANGWWAEVFGGYSRRDQTGVSGDEENRYGSLVVGYARAVSATTRVGFFGGGATGRFTTASDAAATDMSGAYAGLYLDHRAGGLFAKAAVTGGIIGHDSRRSVANNLVEGGVETASASYAGLFVSPSLTVGVEGTAGGITFAPSARLRYSGLFLDGYAESGSTANLTVDSRTAQMAEIRGQMQASVSSVTAGGGQRKASLRAGVDGIFSWGGAVDATLLGSDIGFATVDEDAAARGFVGADAAFVAAGGASFTAGVEVGYDTVEVLTVGAKMRLATRF